MAATALLLLSVDLFATMTDCAGSAVADTPQTITDRNLNCQRPCCKIFRGVR